MKPKLIPTITILYSSNYNINYTIYEIDDPHHMYHREDGPAIEWEDGFKIWYYQGNKVPVSNQEEFEQWLRLKAFW